MKASTATVNRCFYFREAVCKSACNVTCISNRGVIKISLCAETAIYFWLHPSTWLKGVKCYHFVLMVQVAAEYWILGIYQLRCLFSMNEWVSPKWLALFLNGNGQAGFYLGVEGRRLVVQDAGAEYEGGTTFLSLCMRRMASQLIAPAFEPHRLQCSHVLVCVLFQNPPYHLRTEWRTTYWGWTDPRILSVCLKFNQNVDNLMRVHKNYNEDIFCLI